MSAQTVRREHCVACGGTLVSPGLELGALPVCNRFSANDVAPETYPLALSICAACALVQLSVHPAAAPVVPRVPWIRYNEPSGHLDDAAQILNKALSLAAGATVLSTGPFDRPLAERFAAQGLAPLSVDLLEGVEHAPGFFPYLETLQAQIRPERLAEVAAKMGRADLVLCRYVLEHSHDPVASLVGLGALIAPGGHLLIEVPGSRKFLSRNDYSFLWEEHISYFTESTLKRTVASAGYEVVALLCYENLMEDQLVAVLRPAVGPAAADAVADEEPSLFARFRDAFPRSRDTCRQKMQAIVEAGTKIAAYGVGHQAIFFLNAMGAAPYIAFLSDDDPQKIGLYMPGFDRPILPSAAIEDDADVGICLLATNPLIEDKIRGKLPRFLARGGEFYSIFSGIGHPSLSGTAA
jgi:hypothetical protein